MKKFLLFILTLVVIALCLAIFVPTKTMLNIANRKTNSDGFYDIGEGLYLDVDGAAVVKYFDDTYKYEDQNTNVIISSDIYAVIKLELKTKNAILRWSDGVSRDTCYMYADKDYEIDNSCLPLWASLTGIKTELEQELQDLDLSWLDNWFVQKFIDIKF